ncbi:MAG: hypothetical protein ACRDYE_01305 [Acidimicrobiales bacterium]
MSCETGSGRFELRLYGSEGFAVSSWWIGMFDSLGTLHRTWISNGTDLTSRDLQQWLRPIVGYQTAARLVRMALHVHDRPAPDRRVVATAQPSGLMALRAS